MYIRVFQTLDGGQKDHISSYLQDEMEYEYQVRMRSNHSILLINEAERGNDLALARKASLEQYHLAKVIKVGVEREESSRMVSKLIGNQIVSDHSIRMIVLW